MSLRRAILSKPHMENLQDVEAIKEVKDDELVELDALFGFLYEKELGAPTEQDLASFTALFDKGEKELGSLYRALKNLNADGKTLEAVLNIASNLPKPLPSRTTHRPPPIPRYISVEPEELPEDWRRQLQRMWLEEEYAPEILKRTEQKLCEFVFLTRAKNLPVDLTCLESLQAFYEDVKRRSEENNDGQRRHATLRATFEELRRFAQSIGLPEEAVNRLKATEDELADQERLQPALKMVKNIETPELREIMWRGRDMLEEAGNIKGRRQRHLQRCHAVALVLGSILPARRGDVHRHHIFGKGLFWEPGNNAYRFYYVPKKTQDRVPRPLDVLLHSEWNIFIDALILQDHDPKYLDDLRQKAIAQNRPLYVDHTGKGLSVGWYSSVWAAHVGTGAHIARMKIYDTFVVMGPEGMQYAQVMNHHASSKTTEKYRSSDTKRAMIERAQDSLISIFQDDEDLSDLLLD